MGPSTYKSRKSGHPDLNPEVGILSVGVLSGWDFVRWGFVRWDFAVGILSVGILSSHRVHRRVYACVCESAHGCAYACVFGCNVIIFLIIVFRLPFRGPFWDINSVRKFYKIVSLHRNCITAYNIQKTVSANY